MRYPQTVDKKTQRTKTGLEIPVPTRGEFMRNLKKTADKPVKKSLAPKRRPKK